MKERREHARGQRSTGKSNPKEKVRSKSKLYVRVAIVRKANLFEGVKYWPIDDGVNDGIVDYVRCKQLL